jgi:hypothetical protein
LYRYNTGNLTLGTAAVDDARVYTAVGTAALSAAQALGASQCPPGAASGQPTPATRLALDEGVGNVKATTDGGKTATLAAGAYWLPAGAPSLLNALAAEGVVVTGAAATVAVGSPVTFTVAPVDRCGVPLVGPVATGRLTLLDDVGVSAAHTGVAHPRVMERAGAGAATTVTYTTPGVVEGVGDLTGSYAVTRGCGGAVPIAPKSARFQPLNLSRENLASSLRFSNSTRTATLRRRAPARRRQRQGCTS